MYSGVLGTELTCEIYIGCVYYQRVRHIVGDKYQVREAWLISYGFYLKKFVQFGILDLDFLRN